MTRFLAALAAALVLSGPALAKDPSPVEQAAMIESLGLVLDPTGHVVNDCREAVLPQFLPVPAGGKSALTLVVIPGGTGTAACYGDGPDLHLMLHEGTTFREVFALRGGALILLTSKTKGLRDIAEGGPGASYPLWRWDGAAYVQTGGSVSDGPATKGALILP